MSKFYTGVGSRDVPSHIYNLMVGVGQFLAENGWTLRSGGADGADTAFEIGCDKSKGEKEIYLPWPKFNNNGSPLALKDLSELEMATDIVKKLIPDFDKRPRTHKALFARNIYQVLGQDVNTPSKLTVCYTRDGTPVGGTRVAIYAADKFNVPVYNLYDVDIAVSFMKRIGINNLTYEGIPKKLPSNTKFVFESNTAGFHSKGSALYAAENFGAVVGEGNGPTGQCYALPIGPDKGKMAPATRVASFINEFFKYAEEHKDTWFLFSRHNPSSDLSYSNDKLKAYFDKQNVPNNILFSKAFRNE